MNRLNSTNYSKYLNIPVRKHNRINESPISLNILASSGNNKICERSIITDEHNL